MNLLRFCYALPFLLDVVKSQPSNATTVPNTAINEIVLTAELNISCDDGSSNCTFASCYLMNPNIFTVEGYVNSPPGSYYSSYGDQGFFIDDGTGGIFVETGELLLPQVYVGLLIRLINGRTSCLFGTLTIGFPYSRESSKIEYLTKDVVAPHNPIVFSPRQIGQLAKKPSIAGNPEVVENYCDCLLPFSATAGRLITVRGKAVANLEDDDIYGYKLFLDDGNGVAQVFIDASADIPVDDIRDTLCKDTELIVTGLVGHFAGVGYELLPRTQDDIVVVKTDSEDTP